MIFYFTATGNSLYVSKQLDEERRSIAQAIHDENKHYSYEKIGIVCPIFGHEVPPLVKEFMECSVFETDYFYMILTYGNRHANAAELAEKLCKKLNIAVDYINVILMVDNFLPGFDMEEQKKVDKHVEEQIELIKEDLEERKEWIMPASESDRAAHEEFLSRMKKMPQNDVLHAYHITEDCIGCGICEKICPKGCFKVEDQKSNQDPKACIMCMACIHACPTKAIQMNMPEKNKNARYRNENISICEIIDANIQR